MTETQNPLIAAIEREADNVSLEIYRDVKTQHALEWAHFIDDQITRLTETITALIVTAEESKIFPLDLTSLEAGSTRAPDAVAKPAQDDSPSPSTGGDKPIKLLTDEDRETINKLVRLAKDVGAWRKARPDLTNKQVAHKLKISEPTLYIILKGNKVSEITETKVRKAMRTKNKPAKPEAKNNGAGQFKTEIAFLKMHLEKFIKTENLGPVSAGDVIGIPHSSVVGILNNRLPKAGCIEKLAEFIPEIQANIDALLLAQETV